MLKGARLATAFAFVIGFGTQSVAAARPVTAAPARMHGERVFTIGQVDGKSTFLDPQGRPFFSLGVNHVAMDGYVDPRGVDLYRQTVTAKYGSKDAWAAAQRSRFDRWGVNTVAAFSDVDAFRKRHIAFTPFIRTADGETDVFDPDWAASARAKITQAARRYRGDPNVLGYFIDNELPWTVDLQALGRSGREVFVMGRYFRHPYGRVELINFLKRRYRTPRDLLADFPEARLSGDTWSTFDAANAVLGTKITLHGQGTLDEWAQVVARRYFAVTDGALRATDPAHLNFGLKFIAGLTPRSIVKLEAPYVDAIAVDFYDTGALASGGSGKRPGAADHAAAFERLVLPLIDFDTVMPTRGMLSDWPKLTGKPVLVAEFSYRAEDSGLPNTVPPGVAVVPDQTARGRANLNYGRCAINAPYFLCLQWFELYDEPAAGRFDGENSNWGLVTATDEPYRSVTSALSSLSRLASRRLRPDFRPQPCQPVGVQDFRNVVQP